MANKKSVLQDPLLLSQLTWHDIEDLVVMELFSVTRRDPLSVGGYLNIDALDSGLFRSYFRFEKTDIRRLRSALLVPDVISTPQRVLVPGDEALCITLRRLSSPNRLCELEQLFGRHYSVISSVTSYVLSHIEDKFVHLLKDVNNHTWVDLPTIDMFAQAIHS
ncbi:uncharacterized protein LOC142568566 [Dermacentor variabilis]|uniref:uncharacterized protein LOC142568566 n=1 Tax=Dermacentor variabilis TaxID=34621 RepID=UPI003F5AF99C